MGALELSVNPDVVRWVRESSGYSLDDVARKENISERELRSWEETRSEIPFSSLKKMAGFFRRPVAVYLLPTPPVEPGTPPDFRSLKRKESGFKPETLLAVRRARRLAEIAEELYSSLNETDKAELKEARLDDDPGKIALRERERFNVSFADQMKFKDPEIAFKSFKDAIERLNILVFQFKMPVEDARGFSLADNAPFVIVVNKKDAATAKCFTLFHEYAHLLLRKSGVCMPSPEFSEGNNTTNERLEAWCNDFAGSFLVPESVLRGSLKQGDAATQNAYALAGKYRVSELMLLTRMRRLGIISQTAYARETERFKAFEKAQKEKPPASGGKKSGGRSFPQNQCLNERGKRFVSLVLEGMDKRVINHKNAIDYLALDSKHFTKLKKAVAR